MYLWMVLATLLAALAAYVLPLRNDMVGVVDTPVAQAMMIQMVAKHKAGLDYMKYNGYPYACPAGHTYSAADHSCAERNMVTYGVGDANDASAPFLPLGFVNNSHYSNEIRCLCRTGTQANPSYSAAANCNATCGNNTPVLRTLLTQGPIPERWLLRDDSGNAIPSGDLTSAMRKHFGHSQIAGYIVKSGGNYFIRNFEGTDFLIPTQFNGRTCIDSNDACFGYMSFR